ncbi:MAG: hypothetical protein AAGK78_04790 [Planctomycetota bacterium]
MSSVDASKEPEVIVLGDSVAALIAAWRLGSAGVATLLANLNTTPLPDRLGTLAPEFFGLHDDLAPLAKSLSPAPLSGAIFLEGEEVAATREPGSALEHHEMGTPLAYVTSGDALRDALRPMVEAAGVATISATPEKTTVEAVDQTGVTLYVAGKTVRPKIVVACDPLPGDIAASLEADAFTTADAPTVALVDLETAPTGPAADGMLPMALNLGGDLAWGWLLHDGGRTQVCVQRSGGEAAELVQDWLDLLSRNGMLAETRITPRQITQMRLPLGGALTRDVVARRTLLAGPAGGFYSASGEEFYPSAWSGLFAADVAIEAAKAEHVQDALGTYRSVWGATLGDYLRGPQQNLRFLLPLVYKNPAMTDRLAEAILRGQSLVK